jgi:DNA-3-methyladenine glycosylase I
MSTRVTTPRRCPWADSDPLLRAYHDTEWGVPVHDSRALWEVLMLEGFQAGLSWITVLRKRDAFCTAFKGFDPTVVAKFGAADVSRLLKNPGIIRSRSKIEATINNARLFVAMEAAGDDLSTLVWSMAGNRTIMLKGKVPSKTPISEAISKQLKLRGYKYVGPVVVYAWMQATGIANDHVVGCFRRTASRGARTSSRSRSRAPRRLSKDPAAR